ncbi:prepilin-type N-terminal cleavage/methylation domain-containing protein [Alloiococcus sp. CFN-8]|uniref:prepilin-type N-terminal cleavage/methylation domain-containing protein n=1 Tax=Alloiococcus sp. CFN-8 TaxID=3416081 RepID=UPI003CF0CB13
MKKKGFTLLELIVYLAIAAIITAVAVTSVKSVNNFRIKYTNKICQKEIALFIHRARMYCYARRIDGVINLDVGTNTNRLTFSSNINVIDQFFLKSKKLEYEGGLKKLTITSYGKIPQNGKIKFVDENNKSVRISLHVGSEYVEEEP